MRASRLCILHLCLHFPMMSKVVAKTHRYRKYEGEIEGVLLPKAASLLLRTDDADLPRHPDRECSRASQMRRMVFSIDLHSVAAGER